MDEYIKLDEVIMGMDGLINEAATSTQARALLIAKDMIYDQQRYIQRMNPVKRGHWLICSDGYYPYCSECGHWPKEMSKFCEECGADMQEEGKE